MKIFRLAFGLLTLVGFGSILAADDAKPPEKERMLDTASHFDGLLYKSEVTWEAIRNTGGVDAKTGHDPKGIGLIPATERAVAAIAKLLPQWKDEWELHCAKRKRIGGDSWLYEISFVKQASRVPDSPSEQLNIWVLFDGTVVPTKISRNAQPTQ